MAKDKSKYRPARPYEEPAPRAERRVPFDYLRGTTNDWDLTTNEDRWQRITTTRYEPQPTHFHANRHQKPSPGSPGVQLDVAEDDPGLNSGGE